ncbi:MAG: hypothetical protein OXO51_11210 [Gemmatimonadota bacterium]|nr:hypothetical protein [Gemmatimonadota bacterium]
MEHLERLRNLEHRLFELKDQLKPLQDQEEELRNELKDLIPEKGYKGPFLTMTWRNRYTDWKAVVDMLVGGNAEAIDRYAEEFRRPGKTLNVTYTPQKKDQRGNNPEIEDERNLIENQLHWEAINDQQRRFEAVEDVMADYMEHRSEYGGTEDRLLVEWWQQHQQE